MKFSIITCTWNSVATLAETIASVQAQQGVDIEHIFVDGGSTDGTLELIASSCPGALVLSGVRGGISRAMNAGIEAATGDLVAHLHSDDYYADAQALRRVQAAFQASPAAQWAVGRINVVRDGQLLELPPAKYKLTASRFAQGAVSIPHPAVFVRRSLFTDLGAFKENLKYAMDIDLWLRFLPQHQPLLLGEVLAVFREHDGSVSTANVLAARLEERQVRRSHFWQQPLSSLVYELRFQRRFRRLKRQLMKA
jgi:glycosyltransferase involved in cell wall biosynthesis